MAGFCSGNGLEYLTIDGRRSSYGGENIPLVTKRIKYNSVGDAESEGEHRGHVTQAVTRAVYVHHVHVPARTPPVLIPPVLIPPVLGLSV